MQAVRVDQVRLTRLQARLHHLSDFKRRRKMPPGTAASTANMSSHPPPGEYCGILMCLLLEGWLLLICRIHKVKYVVAMQKTKRLTDFEHLTVYNNFFETEGFLRS